LTAIQFTVSKQTVAFTISKDPNLNALIAASAVPTWGYIPGAKKPAPFTIGIPAVLDVSGTTFPIVVTFIVTCQQTSTAVRGSASKLQ